MNTALVDDFSARLATELQALSLADRNDLLTRIGRQESCMRAAGQEYPAWRGPVPADQLLGAEVVVLTDRGERRGRVICYGVVENGTEYERSVVVHVAASGTQHEAPGSAVRLAAAEDRVRMENEREMAGRLAEAAYAATRGPKRPEEALRRQRKRGLRDPDLIERMVEAARRHRNVKHVDEGSANFKVTAADPVGKDQPASRRIYIFKTQLRVDVSGFSFDHPGLRQISDEEARDMHLGKVRGQILFDNREDAMGAFQAALDGLA